MRLILLEVTIKPMVLFSSDCAVSQQKGMNFTSKIGLIEIDTGAKVTKVKYQINGDENVKDETFVTLNTKLSDIVAKAKKWKGF